MNSRSNFFIWKDAFQVAIPLLDHEHKRFFEIINELFAAMTRNDEREVLQKTLADLLRYAQMHFRHEEEFLAKADYPRLAEQQGQHAFFVETVEQFSADSSVSAFAALAMMKNWMLDHVLGTDREAAIWYHHNHGPQILKRTA